MKKLAPLIAFALLSAQPLSAQSPSNDEMVEIEEGEPVNIRPDKAYILFRTYRPKGVLSVEPVLLRVPSAAEIEEFDKAKAAAFAEEQPKLVSKREKQLEKKKRADERGKSFKGKIPPVPSIENFDFAYEQISNLQNIDDSKPLIKSKPERTYLVEAKPGDYVLYGASFGSGLFKPGLHVCFCLGSVGFSAKAGEVTDMGFFLGDGAKFKSKIKELEVESGFGPSSDPFLILLTGTVRPANAETSKPEILANAKLVPADYHAVGKYFNPGAMGINRLVPVPGILDYDNGKVIDVKTGEIAVDRY